MRMTLGLIRLTNQIRVRPRDLKPISSYELSNHTDTATREVVFLKVPRFVRFLFPRASDRWLTFLRIGLGVQIIAYCSTLLPNWRLLLVSNGNGLLSRDVNEAISTIESPFLPTLSWFVQLGNHFGLDEASVLVAVLFCLLISAACLIAGFLCRPAAITAWLLHLACVTSTELMSYGVDIFTTIGLFYLMLSPLPDRASLDVKIRKAHASDPRRLGFFQRVLQLHLCFIYFFSGVDKALGTGWWNGASIWRALTRPPFDIFPAVSVAHWSGFFTVAGISVFLLEMAYPIFIWPIKTRRVWFLSVISMHLGIALLMGMYLFGLIMIVLNTAAFGLSNNRSASRVFA